MNAFQLNINSNASALPEKPSSEQLYEEYNEMLQGILPFLKRQQLDLAEELASSLDALNHCRKYEEGSSIEAPNSDAIEELCQLSALDDYLSLLLEQGVLKDGYAESKCQQLELQMKRYLTLE